MRRPVGRGFVIAATVGVAVALQGFAITPPLLNVDEAIEGLAARHVLQGEVPIFFYGQAHMGTLGVFGLAVLLAAHIPPALAVKLVAVGIYALFGVSLTGLARVAFDAATARLVALWVLLPAPYLFEWSHEGRTHYTLVLLLGTLLLLAAYRLAAPAAPPRQWLVFGLLGGLGLWTSFFSLFYLLPAVAVAAMAPDLRRLARGAPLALVGFALGSAPFWGFNVTHGMGSFDFGQAAAVPLRLRPAVQRLLTVTIPTLTGPGPFSGRPGPIGWATAALALGALAAAVPAAARAWRDRRAARWAWALVLGTAAVTIAANLGAAYGQDALRIAGAPGPLMAEGRAADARYALALAGLLPLLLARLCLGLGTVVRGAGVGLATALLVVHAVLDARLALGLDGQTPAARTAALGDEAARRFLQAARVEAVYMPEWPSLRAFLWGPELPVVHPYQEIYPPLAVRADAAQRVAFLLREDDAHWMALPESLRAAGITVREAHIGRWRVLWELASPGPAAVRRPDGWRVGASVRPEDAAAAIDGDLSTRWATGGRRRDGDRFSVDLGRVDTVAGVGWVPGSYREAPSGVRAEGSSDGQRWVPLVEVRTYLGPVFTSGPHPFVRLDGRVELRFTPTPLRYLRLTHVGEAPVSWSIGELVLLVPGPPPAVRDLPALVRALAAAGIRRVHADHWHAAVLEARSGGTIVGSIERAGLYGGRVPRGDGPRPLRLGDGEALVVEAEVAAGAIAALEAEGVAVRVERVEGFAVIRAYEEARSPWRPAAPGTWTATATSRPDEARAAVDGRRETAWRSGAPQRSGMALELAARVPVRLGGLRLVPARSGEGPRGLAVELSSDGQTWEPVATRGRGEVAWTGWHVVRLSREGYVVSFAPRDVRGVRVVLTADAPAEWSVAEVEWHE